MEARKGISTQAVDPSTLRDISDPFPAFDPSTLRDGLDRLGPVARTSAPVDYGQPDPWQLRPADPYGIGSVASPTVGNGFQWGDAGIGGAVGFGIGLALLAMGVAIVRRNRHSDETGRPALA